MSPPDLSDHSQRRANRAELRRLHLGWRMAGLGLLAIAGIGMVFDPERSALWYVVGALSLIVIIGVIAARTRYHMRRMR